MTAADFKERKSCTFCCFEKHKHDRDGLRNGTNVAIICLQATIKSA